MNDFELLRDRNFPDRIQKLVLHEVGGKILGWYPVDEAIDKYGDWRVTHGYSNGGGELALWMLPPKGEKTMKTVNESNRHEGRREVLRGSARVVKAVPGKGIVASRKIVSKKKVVEEEEWVGYFEPEFILNKSNSIPDKKEAQRLSNWIIENEYDADCNSEEEFLKKYSFDDLYKKMKGLSSSKKISASSDYYGWWTKYYDQGDWSDFSSDFSYEVDEAECSADSAPDYGLTHVKWLLAKPEYQDLLADSGYDQAELVTDKSGNLSVVQQIGGSVFDITDDVKRIVSSEKY